ncbi:MAG: radical SAM protein [Candidatus Omnitrophica bacterium]|nr:radical SAM protein [Candidatus Omnitrophota bacterium]
MKVKDQIIIAKSILDAKLFRKRRPLLASLYITYRCNLQCPYCGYFKANSDELHWREVVSLVDELVRLGNKCIIFSGGEVLLKEGIGNIIDHCVNRGVCTIINSNGTLIEEKIDDIKAAHFIQLSLDGPKSIHDRIRGRAGVYEKVINAITILKERGIKVSITTVLSKYNLLTVDHVLWVAEHFKIGVLFQPTTQTILGEDDPNPLMPPPDEYRRVIASLIQRKKAGFKFIRNSISGLTYLYDWPHVRPISCIAKYLHCYITPDGRMISCAHVAEYKKRLVSINKDFKNAYKNMYVVSRCSQCHCGNMVELNLGSSFHLDALITMWKNNKDI